MEEKLSVRKVYRNAYRYVASHLFAFLFLTVFYFLGSLLPLFVGEAPGQAISLIYMYVFFYFAAGCYYKQMLLWDKKVFLTAGLRFLTAAVLFLCALFFSGIVINSGLYFVRMAFPEYGSVVLNAILESVPWLMAKYLFIFMLFVAFFIVPSFAFVSEITGKNRSLLTTYAKTRGNLFKIGLASFAAFALMVAAMVALTYVNIIIAAVARAGVLAFISILYFKMYDFFYNFARLRSEANSKRSVSKSERALKQAGRKRDGKKQDLAANADVTADGGLIDVTAGRSLATDENSANTAENGKGKVVNMPR